MAFQFPLRAVLRLRVGLERLERLRLLAISSLLARVRRAVAALDEESANARRLVQQTLGVGTTSAELQFAAACENNRAAQRRILQARQSELERQEKKQRAAFQAARQRREILENLRERRWEEYRRVQGRREQQQLDDLLLIHRGAKSSQPDSD